MPSVEAVRQQAQEEKLTLLVADNSTGYFGVHVSLGTTRSAST